MPVVLSGQYQASPKRLPIRCATADPPATPPAPLPRTSRNLPRSRSSSGVKEPAERETPKQPEDPELHAYARALEARLAAQDVAIEEEVLMHQDIEKRLAELEEGICWRDSQLDATTRQLADMWRNTSEWQQRAMRLEEEIAVLRDALLERTTEGEKLKVHLQAQQDLQNDEGAMASPKPEQSEP